MCTEVCNVAAHHTSVSRVPVWLQEFDTQLQRALNYENFDAANAIRTRRQQVS